MKKYADLLGMLKEPGVLKATAPWALGGAGIGGALGAANYALEDPEKKKHDSLMQSMGLGAALGGVSGTGIKALAGMPLPFMPGPASLTKTNPWEGFSQAAAAKPGLLGRIFHLPKSIAEHGLSMFAQHPEVAGASGAGLGMLTPSFRAGMGGFGKKTIDAVKGKKDPFKEAVDNLKGITSEDGKAQFHVDAINKLRENLAKAVTPDPGVPGPPSPAVAADLQARLNKNLTDYAANPTGYYNSALADAEGLLPKVDTSAMGAIRGVGKGIWGGFRTLSGPFAGFGLAEGTARGTHALMENWEADNLANQANQGQPR